MKQFFNNFVGNPKNDILSGITVALALVPEAVAFAFVAGIDPLVGLYGAFMMGLITSLFGGRPGMISGATGAMAVVMVHLIQKGNEVGNAMQLENLGLSWLFITLLIVGCIQILAGLFPFGKIRSSYSTSSNDGICQWIGNRHFLKPIGHVHTCG